MPEKISIDEFLQNGLNEVVNKENFINHLQKSNDKEQRLSFLNLVEPTMQKANIEFESKNANNELRKAYLKAFEYGKNRELFYMLITEQNDKLLISGYPITKEKELKRVLKKAENIKIKDEAFEEITTRPELNKSSTLDTIIPQSKRQSK